MECTSGVREHYASRLGVWIKYALDPSRVWGVPGFSISEESQDQQLREDLEPFGSGEEAIINFVQYLFNVDPVVQSGLDLVGPVAESRYVEVPALVSSTRKFEPFHLSPAVCRYLQSVSDWRQRLTLHDLPVGTVAFACPWSLQYNCRGISITQDKVGPLLLVGEYTVRETPDSNFSMRVERVEDGFRVSKPDGYEPLRWRNIPEPTWLPVTK
jgi:hypothetical protein